MSFEAEAIALEALKELEAGMAEYNSRDMLKSDWRRVCYENV
jgi:hypothetical protein